MSYSKAVDLLEALRGQSPVLMLAAGLSIVALLGLADFATGWELSFSIFYLVPIAISAWGAGPRGGLLVASVSVAVGFGTDYLAGSAYSSDLVHLWNVMARLGVFVTVALTLVALRSALDHARAQAGMDSLTGLPNARHFFTQLDGELRDAARRDTPLTLAFIDLDNFKSVNDTLGHRAGDEVLRAMAAVLHAALRAHDKVGRLGGDEFAILLPHTALAEAQLALARVMQAADAEIVAHGWPISLSIGAVAVERGSASSEDLMHAADELMYRVKRAGKGSLAVEPFAA